MDEHASATASMSVISPAGIRFSRAAFARNDDSVMCSVVAMWVMFGPLGRNCLAISWNQRAWRGSVDMHTAWDGLSRVAWHDATLPDQRECSIGTSASSGIGLGRILLAPGVDHRIDPLPCGVKFVASHEKCKSAPDHIEQEPLVGIPSSRRERRRKFEVQTHRPDRHIVTRRLGHQVEFQAFVWLQPDHETITPAGRRGRAEHPMRY